MSRCRVLLLALICKLELRNFAPLCVMLPLHPPRQHHHFYWSHQHFLSLNLYFYATVCCSNNTSGTLESAEYDSVHGVLDEGLPEVAGDYDKRHLPSARKY